MRLRVIDSPADDDLVPPSVERAPWAIVNVSGEAAVEHYADDRPRRIAFYATRPDAVRAMAAAGYPKWARIVQRERE